MKLSEDLAWRGLIKDKTFASNSWLDSPKTFYWGVDCSADSLTIGNLAPLLLARRLAEAGWEAVLLVGGATSLIGDPGGKEEERELLRREAIKHNGEEIASQVSKVFSGQNFKPVNNYNWWEGEGENYEGVKYLDFLREYGKRFSMTELMQRDFVTERMGESGAGISYAEFSYGLVQGYDFYQLNSKENLDVCLQIGGSDQWSNMLMGVALIRKKLSKEVHALSMPLIVNKATGKKFGKTEDGAIWLDADKTTPFKFYQFWLNTTDEDVEEYLKVFSFMTRPEIEDLLDTHANDRSQRLAQKSLAHQVTAIVHGKDEAEKQQNVALALFGGNGIESLSASEITIAKEEISSLSIQPGTPVVEALVKTELATSNSEARRLLQSKAIYVNNQSFTKDHLDSGDFQNGRLILRRGKAYKDSALIELA